MLRYVAVFLAQSAESGRRVLSIEERVAEIEG